MTLDRDLAERKRQMALVSRFVASKLSPSFTMACELAEPDAMYCVAISHRECNGVVSLIKHDLLRFLPEHWLTPDQIDNDVLGMLPKGETSLGIPTLMALEDWFGPRGRFPALKFGKE